ncbi:BEN domain-containing protein [Trichonephila clavata]|uniref:BEN domain-containing protein n=1 Tax=Trichonephila clavata TaxID=2740835 RepID=A0A8X6LRJ9_TRICU|nr:BEN domain-containing protein [Trichonephila clavata]GFR17289.1 BEN domain-containing protein [Trichonephila clavata]
MALSWNQIERESLIDTSAIFPSDEQLLSLYSRCQNHPNQFAVNIARMIFSPEEMKNSNCRGVKQKFALDKGRLTFIRNAVIKYYRIPPSYQVEIWKQCMQGIDTRCRHERRPKLKDIIFS